MSGLLKWVEAKLEQFDAVAEEAVSGSVEEVRSDEQLKQYIGKLKHDFASLKSIFRQQMLELKDRYQAQLDNAQDTNRSLEASLKQMNDESLVLKDSIRALRSQVDTLESLKEQWANSLETYSLDTDSSQNEDHSRLSQQVTVYREFIAAEKRKAEDAIREKRQLEELLDTTKDRQQEVLAELRQQIEQAHAREKQLESLLEEVRNEHASRADEKNMLALSENLQTKQRTIESLMSEKATLLYQLEAEVSTRQKQEKTNLITQTPPQHTGFQSLTTLGVSNRTVRSGLVWADSVFKEVVHVLEETPMARLAYMVYVVMLHLLVFYWVIMPDSQPFLGPS